MQNLLLYTTQDKKVKVELYELGESVFLAQDTMAKLFLKKLRFDTSKQNMSLHIRNILQEGELQADFSFGKSEQLLVVANHTKAHNETR